MAIKLDIGQEPFELDFGNKRKETIYFNPADPELAVRLYNLKDRLSERGKEVEKDVTLKPDGTPEKEDDLQAFSKMLDIIYEEIDNAFRSEISKTVFKWCSPFALVKGKRFMIQFVEAISPEIDKRVKEARAEEEKIINGDYLAQYAK